MTKEQMRELFEMFLTMPKSDKFCIKFEFDSQDNDVTVFVHGKNRCECCGSLHDVSEYKMSDNYGVIKEFIEKWAKIIEKENENE